MQISLKKLCKHRIVVAFTTQQNESGVSIRPIDEEVNMSEKN